MLIERGNRENEGLPALPPSSAPWFLPSFLIVVRTPNFVLLCKEQILWLNSWSSEGPQNTDKTTQGLLLKGHQMSCVLKFTQLFCCVCLAYEIGPSQMEHCTLRTQTAASTPPPLFTDYSSGKN